ncbi:MAG: 2-succinyl-6-hydroxy-2,4-cyclohexadiene-1-carboxylate synthase [Dehalococcoidia bacterium]|nr:2-succinyl-6-hydroxy-2,4-cyclohexadiene-1-carboxylate synthase [Dehalococcoidia bacterium]
MERLLINRVRLNVEVSGTGPHVLAIHGFTGSTATWATLATAVGKEYTVVAVDMLGHGASDAPRDPKRYSMERCIEDLEAILDHLEIERVRWLGYSMGGRIALSAAIALPQRTSGLVAESASPGLATAEERASRVQDDEKLAERIEQDGIKRFVDYWGAIPLFASQARLPATIRDRLRAQRLRSSPLGLANSLRGIGTGAQPSVHELLSNLAMPTLWIAGKEDAKFAGIARDMHRLVPGSEMHIVPKAGHAVHLEQPDDFNQAVLGFLRERKPVSSQVQG